MTYTTPPDNVLVVSDVIQPLACETNSLDKLRELTASYSVQAFSTDHIVVKGKSYSSIHYENFVIQIQDEYSEIHPIFYLKNYSSEILYIHCDNPTDLYEVQINLQNFLVYNTAMLTNVINIRTQNEIGEAFHINADYIARSTMKELLQTYPIESGTEFIASLINSALERFGMLIIKKESLNFCVPISKQNFGCKNSTRELILPHNQTAFEFFIGESKFTYGSKDLISKHQLNELKLNLLNQLITTLKLTYVNYSNTGISLNNEHINKIEKLKCSIS